MTHSAYASLRMPLRVHVHVNSLMIYLTLFVWMNSVVSFQTHHFHVHVHVHGASTSNAAARATVTTGAIKCNNQDPATFRLRLTSLRQSKSVGDDNNDDDSEFFKNIQEDQSDIMEELKWRTKKVELEEAERSRFQKRIKSKPWKLPYDDARKWVQSNFGIETKEEFFDLVENGNLRTPYIPKHPEKYYSEKGTWISWEHFLQKKP